MKPVFTALFEGVEIEAFDRVGCPLKSIYEFDDGTVIIHDDVFYRASYIREYICSLYRVRARVGLVHVHIVFCDAANESIHYTLCYF